jgi:hypothetical protein
MLYQSIMLVLVSMLANSDFGGEVIQQRYIRVD